MSIWQKARASTSANRRSSGRCAPWAGHEKKTLAASGRDPVERAARRWQATLLLRAPDLVFVDESGSNRALCPRSGSAPQGARCHGQARATADATLRSSLPWVSTGLVAAMTVEGSTNKEAFLTCLENVLCPALRPGQIVVMDNLAV